MEKNCIGKKELRSSIEAYIPFNEQEAMDKQAMLYFIDSFDDVVTRNNVLGHFSATSFVVNASKTKTLMVHHNIFGSFISPGGHADGEYDLLSVALREVEEETGLTVEPLYNGQIFAIQATPIQGHIKNRKYVSPHIHYDVLYLCVAKDEDMDKIRVLASENSKVEWRSIADTLNNDVVDWVRPINYKIVKKMEAL